MYFMHRIRRVNGVIDKGIEVKETFDAAKQAYAAQMAAFAYGANENCDYCSCMITSFEGVVQPKYCETWIRPEQS